MPVHLPDFSAADISKYWSLFKEYCGAWHKLNIEGDKVFVYTEMVPRESFLSACEGFESAQKIPQGQGLVRVYRSPRLKTELELEYDRPRGLLIAASPNANLLQEFLRYLPSRELTPLEKELDIFLREAAPLSTRMVEEFFSEKSRRVLDSLVKKRRAYAIGPMILHRSTIPAEFLPREKELIKNYSAALSNAAALSATKLRLENESRELRDAAQKVALLKG